MSLPESTPRLEDSIENDRDDADQMELQDYGLQKIADTPELDAHHVQHMERLPKEVTISGITFKVPTGKKYVDCGPYVTTEVAQRINYDPLSILNYIVGQKYNKYECFADLKKRCEAKNLRHLDLDTIYYALENKDLTYNANYGPQEIVDDLIVLKANVKAMKWKRPGIMVRKCDALFKDMVDELDKAIACKYCVGHYYEYVNWFELPCPQPHTLVWVRFSNESWWPAKVVEAIKTIVVKPAEGQEEKEDLIKIQCFGGQHSSHWVLTENCVLMVEHSHQTFFGNSAEVQTASRELKNHLIMLFAAFNEEIVTGCSSNAMSVKLERKHETLQWDHAARLFGIKPRSQQPKVYRSQSQGYSTQDDGARGTKRTVDGKKKASQPNHIKPLPSSQLSQDSISQMSDTCSRARGIKRTAEDYPSYEAENDDFI